MSETKESFFLVKTDTENPIDLSKTFSKLSPLIIEIGSGKGEFISQYSLAHPEWNFIGFELKKKRIISTIKKLDITLNPNVRLVNKAVDCDIERYFPPECIFRIFIQHPDPWPKRKHFPRRLIQHSLLNVCWKLLGLNGEIHISTDNKAYAEWTVKHFSQRDDFISIYPNVIERVNPDPNHVQTWYEIEQRRLGYEPCFMAYRKVVR